MARRLGVALAAVSLVCAALLVVSMCAPGADAARRLETSFVAVATGRVEVQMAALVREGETGEGEGGSVAASERHSPGGPDPQHH